MTQKNPQVLYNSQNRQELLKTALDYARSPLQEDQDVLLRFLRTEGFLTRLDSPQDYQQMEPRHLRLARIIKALMDNGSQAAQRTLLALTQSPTFTEDEGRVELLIEALVVIRPAPPEAIRFWDQYSQPDCPEVHMVMDALADNGSEPAISLFEKKMSTPGFEPEELVAWMRDPILRHRNDPLMLKACQRLLVGGLPEEIRTDLVEALYDYRPDHWYAADLKPQPPPRSSATKEARDLMRAICDYALEHVTLSPRQRAAVEAALKELDLLDGRK